MNDDNSSRRSALGARHIDFGADDEVVPPSGPEFDAWVARMAPGLNEPNVAPRADMWDAIQAARRSAQDAAAGQVPGVSPIRRAPWRLMSVVAAALLLGVAIDRFALRGPDTATAPVASAPSVTPDASDPARLYRMAAAQTLTQAEALLTAYRAGGVAAQNPAAARQLGRWGRDILSSTRLLLDSPAGGDPQFRPLLNDLELVLVQIIEFSGAPLDAGERALIDRALQERDLLPRIRTAVPGGVAGPATD